MNKVNFFRLDNATAAELDACARERSLQDSATDLRMKVRVGDHVLAARYDSNIGTGLVRAIGRILRADAVLDVAWRVAKVDLQPNPQGCQQW